jgi:hypothetical protein
MTTGLLMSGPAGRGSDSRCAPIMPHAPAFLYRNCRARAPLMLPSGQADSLASLNRRPRRVVWPAATPP